MPMAKQTKQPINVLNEINKKLSSLYLQALKIKMPGSKKQLLIIKEIDALNELKDKFLNKNGSRAKTSKKQIGK